MILFLFPSELSFNVFLLFFKEFLGELDFLADSLKNAAIVLVLGFSSLSGSELQLTGFKFFEIEVCVLGLVWGLFLMEEIELFGETALNESQRDVFLIEVLEEVGVWVRLFDVFNCGVEGDSNSLVFGVLILPSCKILFSLLGLWTGVTNFEIFCPRGTEIKATFFFPLPGVVWDFFTDRVVDTGVDEVGTLTAFKLFSSLVEELLVARISFRSSSVTTFVNLVIKFVLGDLGSLGDSSTSSLFLEFSIVKSPSPYFSLTSW